MKMDDFVLCVNIHSATRSYTYCTFYFWFYYIHLYLSQSLASPVSIRSRVQGQEGARLLFFMCSNI